MDICYPPDTDWSCMYDAKTLERMRDDEEDSILLERAESFAWSLLAALTAYQIGTCPVVVRPCSKRCGGGSLFASSVVGGTRPGTIGRFAPYISNGVWYNACGCRDENSCSCTTLSTVVLPGPVGRLVSVQVDGYTMEPEDYRVDNGNELVRLDGGEWPVCQDMTLPASQGFAVTYYRGAAPNAMTRAAAGALAAEFVKSCKGDDSCRLPANVRSVNQNGIAYDFAPTDFEGGDTGIPEVNAVIRIYNPYGLKTPPQIASPDAYTGSRMWTA